MSYPVPVTGLVLIVQSISATVPIQHQGEVLLIVAVKLSCNRLLVVFISLRVYFFLPGVQSDFYLELTWPKRKVLLHI